MVHPSQQHAAAEQQQQHPFLVQQQQQQFAVQAPHHPVVNYPLRQIPQPHAHDVLCGRGTCVRQTRDALPLL